MSLLLKNALVADLKSPYHNKKKDILIKNGLVAGIGGGSARKTIDCSGLVLTPGWCDLNANFCDPGNEHKEDFLTGSQGAIRGGFTDVHVIPETNPPFTSKSDVEYVRSKQLKELNLHVSAAVSEGCEGQNLTEMMDLREAGACSFSEGDKPISNSKLLLKALQYTSQMDVPVFQNARDSHLAENAHMHEGKVSTSLGVKGEPGLSEFLTIERDLSILRYSGGKIHFSKISTAKGVELIKKAKKEGLAVTCDVSIFHLLFTEANIGEFDAAYKLQPPLRTVSDKKALLKGISDGTIDAICSDHRPQDLESKKLEFDLAEPGAISHQVFFSALLQVEGVPMETLIERVTHGPRSVLGLDEVVIDKGAVATLTLLDPKREWVLNAASNVSKSTNSPFWEKHLKGTG